jgi:putative ABC transport system permease protein
MRLALRELRRRPAKFVASAIILTLVSLLVIYLGGLIDGIARGGTGALRTQSADLLVFSKQSGLSIPESRITNETRTVIAALPGVTSVDGLGETELGARLPGGNDRHLIDVAVFGYEHATRRLPSPPPPGQALADQSLADQGITTGVTILVGPQRTPLTITGIVSDTNFDGVGTVWTSLNTWRSVQNDNRPAQAAGTDAQQILAVTADIPTAQLRSEIRAAIPDIELTTPTGAVDGLPAVIGPRVVFSAVIGLTTLIGTITIALLFALFVVERISLYGVLKALGIASKALFGSLAVQALSLAAIGLVIGTALGATLGNLVTSGANAYVLTPSRLMISALLVLGASLLGAAITLRRVLHIDPASAIGA